MQGIDGSGLRETTLDTRRRKNRGPGSACSLGKDTSPQPVLKALAKDQITVLSGLPDVNSNLARLPDFGGTSESSLRLVICNSGAVGEETRQRFESSCDAFIVEGYG